MDSMRVSFQEELDAVETAIQEEGDYVLRSLRGVLNAIAQSDLELADEVIAFDDEIDRHYFEIENRIQLLLARQTPVAMDLRLVLAMLHSNLHLERMGDYCVTIAKLLKLGGDPEYREWGLRMIIVSRCLERIGDHAVDIGEQTAYLVTGEFREFTDASHQQDL